jgi:hypothetical protein
MQAREPFALTPDERRSTLWLKLSAYFDERIQALRVQNDAAQPEISTAQLRGQIAALQALKALNVDRPKQEPVDF